MSYVSAMHDRMLACMVIPCRVVALDLAAARVRVSDGSGWTSAWLRWHAQAAGQARHWRAPSLGEQGVLLSPSGEPAQGTFLPGLYGNAGGALTTAGTPRSGVSPTAVRSATTGRPATTTSSYRQAARPSRLAPPRCRSVTVRSACKPPRSTFPATSRSMARCRSAAISTAAGGSSTPPATRPTTNTESSPPMRAFSYQENAMHTHEQGGAP